MKLRYGLVCLMWLFSISSVLALQKVATNNDKPTSTTEYFNPLVCDDNLVQEFLALKQEQKKSFYESYLAKYFPRALVIRGRFLRAMKPAEVDAALNDLVTLFKVNPGFYFSNEAEKVKIALYLEVIIGQLCLISEFLKKAYINTLTEQIFLIIPLINGIGSMPCSFLFDYHKVIKERISKKLLIAYLREKRLTAVDRFYATYFDYLNRLFNQAILFKEVKPAQYYFRELDFVMNKLRTTSFEPIYEQAFNVSKQLLEILRTQCAQDAADEPRKGGHDDDDDDDDDDDRFVGGSNRERSRHGW